MALQTDKSIAVSRRGQHLRISQNSTGGSQVVHVPFAAIHSLVKQIEKAELEILQVIVDEERKKRGIGPGGQDS